MLEVGRCFTLPSVCVGARAAVCEAAVLCLHVVAFHCSRALVHFLLLFGGFASFVVLRCPSEPVFHVQCVLAAACHDKALRLWWPGLGMLQSTAERCLHRLCSCNANAKTLQSMTCELRCRPHDAVTGLYAGDAVVRSWCLLGLKHGGNRLLETAEDLQWSRTGTQ